MLFKEYPAFIQCSVHMKGPVLYKFVQVVNQLIIMT